MKSKDLKKKKSNPKQKSKIKQVKTFINLELKEGKIHLIIWFTIER